MAFRKVKASFKEVNIRTHKIEETYLAVDTTNGELRLGDGATSGGQLLLSGNYYFPLADGSVNQVLKTDGDGTLSWVAQSGGAANEYSFRTIAVSGQSDVVADTTTDTLTLVAGSNMTITTSADTITFVSTDTTLSLIDEDNMATDSATRPPSQQSVKAYVDGQTHGGGGSTGDITFTGSTISSPSNADLTLDPGGTGDVIVGALRIRGTTISSDDSSQITIAEAVQLTGALHFPGTGNNISASTNINFTTTGEFSFQGDMQRVGGAELTTVTDPDGSGTASAINGGGARSLVIHAGDMDDNDNYTNLYLRGEEVIIGKGIDGQANRNLTYMKSVYTEHTGSSGQQPIDSFTAATYRGGKYLISMSDTTNSRYETAEIYVTHNGTTSYIQSIGVSTTGTSMGTFSSDISGGSVRILITPQTSDNVKYRFLRTLLPV
jgi:hypothetical protein